MKEEREHARERSPAVLDEGQKGVAAARGSMRVLVPGEMREVEKVTKIKLLCLPIWQAPQTPATKCKVGAPAVGPPA